MIRNKKSNHNFLCHFPAYCNSCLLDINNYITCHGGYYCIFAAYHKAEIFKVFFHLGTASDMLYNIFLADIGKC